MSTLAKDLAAILSNVRRPGDYYASGRLEVFAPRLEVEGVGTIALPLLPMQAEQLVAAAERAPFGRGTETVVDTNVRRTWQIGADRVRIGGKHWPRTVDDFVARAAEGLGVSEPVSAELYKLLVYDSGSFFVSHRDTEKAPGMFATLVVALPSQSTGGELVVRHKGSEARLDLRCEEPSEIAFAAFYADCVHEVLPITSGCRATLVYNLTRKATSAQPEPPSYEAEATKTIALLRQWRDGGNATADIAPKKLIYPLEHAYTPAELGFSKLKGADAAVASVLSKAAPDAGCDLHLALLSIKESGAAEYNGSYRDRYRRGPQEHEFEAGEIFDRHETLSEWRRPDGAPSTLTALPFEEDEIAPPDALADMTPDEEHFHEATGNEGASFDRTYRRAALVLWPSTRTLAVLNQAGLSATLPYLADLVSRWKDGGDTAKSPARRHALDMAGHILASWPARSWHAQRGSEPTETGRMLTLLSMLEDKDGTRGLIGKLIEQRGHDTSDNDAIHAGLGLFPLDRAADLLRDIVTASAASALGSCAALLAGAARARFADKPAKLLKAAGALIDALPGDPSLAPRDQFGRPMGSSPSAGLIVDLVCFVDVIDPALARRAASHVLAWPKHYDLDTVLVPAMRRLVEAGTAADGQAFAHLHGACLAHLRSRAAEPLEPPKDFSRPNSVGCKCGYCAALGRYLADPKEPSWSLRAAQQIRSHVETTIANSRCDVDTQTERRGSPHTLVCTKNQASYERRVVQRKQDLADIKKLEG